jgi:hypothetical protein
MGLRVWTVFRWLRGGFSDGLLSTWEQTFGYIKSGNLPGLCLDGVKLENCLINQGISCTLESNNEPSVVVMLVCSCMDDWLHRAESF